MYICYVAVMIYRPANAGSAATRQWEGQGPPESCMGLHLPKWHMHLGATCNSEGKPADGDSFWQDKIPQLKIWEGKKKMIFGLEESEVQEKE